MQVQQVKNIASKANPFKILFLGEKTHPMYQVIVNNIQKDFKENQLNYQFCKNIEEYQQVNKEFTSSLNMISIYQNTPSQIEVLKKAYYDSENIVNIIHGFLVGVDSYLPWCHQNCKQDIIFANGKGSFSASLGEFVVYACMYHAKRTTFFQQKKEEKKWIRQPIQMLTNKNIAIVGFGDIGQTVAKYCNGMGLKVQAIKNNPNDVTQEQRDLADKIYGMNQLEEVLGISDYVVNILPLTPETQNLYTLEKFKQMKQSAIFINIGRGQSVVEDDLATAINEKVIAGAVLDVFQKEPLPESSSLWELENVYLSQHCADVTDDYLDLTYRVFADNLNSYLQGGNMKNIVNREKGY